MILKPNSVPNKVIIAGGREFNDYDLLKTKCDSILSNLEDVIIISGDCRGTDKLGEKYAKERGYKCEKYPANWNEYGKVAGYIRNEEMAKIATHLIAFWDNKSPGTKSMINLGTKYNLKKRVIIYA